MPPAELIYWDACIFIAWLKDEKRPHNEMDGILECVTRVEKNEVRLMTSVTTRTEVFEADLTAAVKAMYTRLLQRRNVQQVDADLRVTNLARELREYYNSGKRKLTQPDAIHLATAIHYRADAFYTFDNGNKGDLGLLELDGNVAGRPLHICKPPVSQIRLHFQ